MCVYPAPPYDEMTEIYANRTMVANIIKLVRIYGTFSTFSNAAKTISEGLGETADDASAATTEPALHQ